MRLVQPPHVQSDDELCVTDGSMTDPAIVYNLHSGSNLISFPSYGSMDLSSALPDDIESFITGIITEGDASSQIAPGEWQGSITALIEGKGYWMIADQSVAFSFNLSNLTRMKDDNMAGLTYPAKHVVYQSTQQAFYFIESVEYIQPGDWILAYHGDKLIGSREWSGRYTDVPVMGDDGYDYSAGYIKTGDIPHFKLLKNNKLIPLDGDIAPFSNNQI